MGYDDDAGQSKKPLIVVGSVNADLVLEVDRLPVLGETLAADSMAVFPGGKVRRRRPRCGGGGGSLPPRSPHPAPPVCPSAQGLSLATLPSPSHCCLRRPLLPRDGRAPIPPPPRRGSGTPPTLWGRWGGTRTRACCATRCWPPASTPRCSAPSTAPAAPPSCWCSPRVRAGGRAAVAALSLARRPLLPVAAWLRGAGEGWWRRRRVLSAAPAILPSNNVQTALPPPPRSLQARTASSSWAAPTRATSGPSRRR